jgi:anthranilate 1,2-dioxygenase large subunit
VTISFEWPRNDYSRVPYRLYRDPEIYEEELERVFRGKAWSFIGLEAEIPHPGDFRTSFLGDTPIVINRDNDGAIHCFVNRCAHRGAMVRREIAGNADSHTCIYHQWCYGLDGSLKSVPFRRGIAGKGGLDASFDLGAHGMKRLRIESVSGALFGTLAPDAEPLRAYLGPPVVAQIERMFIRPVKILGYQRQRIYGNWKMFAENTRDNYHASLLHEFLFAFGLDRLTNKGGIAMDPRHRHSITYGETPVEDAEFTKTYAAANARNDRLTLRDPRLVQYRKEHADNLNLMIMSVFPNANFAQIGNSLMTRQIRPKGVGCHEVFQALIGYADDPEDMTLHRHLQSNLVGPAGLIAMEDGEAIELAQVMASTAVPGNQLLEMGGGGAITERDYRVTDVSVRGFWSYYSELMGIEPEGAFR